MARSIQEILDGMRADKASRSELDSLTNASNAAVWDELYESFSVEVHTIESLFDTLDEDIEERANQIPTGTTIWYAAESLEFQYGDSLELIDGIPNYTVEDDTKKIVKYASATESGGFVLIKAAIDDGSGNPVKLGTAEINSFTEYWTLKRFAGTSILIISQDGDEIVTTARIEVNPQIIKLTGESVADTGVFPVEDAIKDYYKNLDFNGRFQIMKLEDAMQSVSGVTNVVINKVEAKAFGQVNYTDITATPNQDYISVAGYSIEDGTTPLNTTLTYVS